MFVINQKSFMSHISPLRYRHKCYTTCRLSCFIKYQFRYISISNRHLIYDLINVDSKLQTNYFTIPRPHIYLQYKHKDFTNEGVIYTNLDSLHIYFRIHCVRNNVLFIMLFEMDFLLTSYTWQDKKILADSP